MEGLQIALPYKCLDELTEIISSFDKPEFQLERGSDNMSRGVYKGVYFTVWVTTIFIGNQTFWGYLKVVISMTDENGQAAKSSEIIKAYMELIPKLKFVSEEKGLGVILQTNKGSDIYPE